MNGTKIASVLLILIVAVVAYSSQIFQKKARAIAAEAQDAESAYVLAKQANSTSEIKLIKLRADTQEMREFLKEWEPIITRLQTSQDAEQLLNGLLRNSGIFTISQRFEVKNINGNTIIPKVLQGTVIVQDEYSKTLNWLGEVERRIPLARINSCKLRQGETGRQINMELQIEIPLIDLNAVGGSAKS